MQWDAWGILRFPNFLGTRHLWKPMTGAPLANQSHDQTQQHACLSQGFFQCWACLFDDSFGTCLQHLINSSTASTSKQQITMQKQNVNPPINSHKFPIKYKHQLQWSQISQEFQPFGHPKSGRASIALWASRPKHFSTCKVAPKQCTCSPTLIQETKKLPRTCEQHSTAVIHHLSRFSHCICQCIWKCGGATNSQDDSFLSPGEGTSHVPWCSKG